MLKEMAKKNHHIVTNDSFGSNPGVSSVCWHVLTVEESIRNINAREDLLKQGLSSFEAAERLEEYGLNEMTVDTKETIWQKIWKQVANILVLILCVVAIVSAARAIVEQVAVPNPNTTTILTSWIQVGLIITVISVNTFIGILQEGSAEKAAEALKKMLSVHACVVRNGKEVLIPACNVVPGDLVILSTGDRCPADIRIVKSSNLACQESALTGEAEPIEKIIHAIDSPSRVNAEQIALGDRRNMAYSATLVSHGSGVGIAIATGDNTQIGAINMLVSRVEKKKTNVLKQIDQVSRLLALLIGIATLVTFFIAKFESGQDTFEAASTALVCCVAMIPEGLEAIVTLTYAWASTNMASNNAIIRTLPAVETLGSVTVICSDKTGTLTQNRMSLAAYITSNAHYRFNMDSHERSPSNFIRDDSFLAQRANLCEQKFDYPEAKKNKFISDCQLGIDIIGDSSEGMEGVSEEKKIVRQENEVKSDLLGCGAEIYSPNISFVRDILSVGVLCSKCILGVGGGREEQIGSPTELAILRAAYFSGCNIEEMKNRYPIVAEVPFSSEYKFMATIHDEGDSHYVVFVKGAPDSMINLCASQVKDGVLSEIEPCDYSYWKEKVATLSSHGLRVLALCRAPISKSCISPGDQLDPDFISGRVEGPWLTFVGLCAIMDPPRPECVRAVREAKGAGVRIAMITGDHKDTATAVGHMLGLIDEQYSSVITGPELDEMTDEEMKLAVMSCNVFARAVPQNKIRIVKALQAQKQICSMTGDGVNDAPALKAADIGVAMGKEGTDVARDASDMILADDNFATIVVAIKEGRAVWDNLRKVIFINTIINNAQGMSILLGLAFGLYHSPLSPIQVLYSNLICAVTLGFVAAIEPAEEGIMNLPPRRTGKRLIGRYLLLRILIGTLTLTCLVVASAFWLKSYNAGNALFSLQDKYDSNSITAQPGEVSDENGRIVLKYYLEDVRASAFNVLDFGAISVTLSARFTYLSSFHPRIFKGNKYCWYSIFVVIILQIILTYTPVVNDVVFQMKGMDVRQWGIVLLFTVIMFLVMEVEKSLRRHLKFRGEDTDDRQYGLFDNITEGEDGADEMLLPKGSSRLSLVALDK